MADELIDIFDKNNRPLNIQRMKSEAHKDELWHRGVHIWIYNTEKGLFIQKRASDKNLHPDLWDISVAGHVSAGETPETSAVREISEEISLEINPEELELYKIRTISKTKSGYYDKEFDYIYFLRYEGEISSLTLQQEEVQEIKCIPLDELEKDLGENSGKYTPRGEYWFEIIRVLKEKLHS